MLRGLGHNEVESILQEQGEIKINCEFCNTNYIFHAEDISKIFIIQAIEQEPVSKELH